MCRDAFSMKNAKGAALVTHRTCANITSNKNHRFIFPLGDLFNKLTENLFTANRGQFDETPLIK